MPETNALTDGIWVSAQVRPEDVPTLASTFRTIVNNRPDGEEVEQPTSAQIEAAVRHAGLEYAFIPFTPGQLTEKEIVGLGQVLADASRPVLLFCRTGTRSANLWALSEAGMRSTDEILKIAADAGYDLTALQPRLAEKATPA